MKLTLPSDRLNMRTIAVATVGRSDYGIYLPVLREIDRQPDLKLTVVAGGMHFSPEFGMTVLSLEHDGFDVAERVEVRATSDSPVAVAEAIGLGIAGFAQAYARCRPDLLVVLGDRYEMHAAALAALPLGIPTAHIHGGELAEGAIADALRHCITKLSHLHFVSTETYARRIVQLGEEPWRVFVTGAPSLDNLRTFEPLSRAEVEARVGMALDTAPLLVTYHPVSLEPAGAELWQMAELFAALRDSGRPLVFTLPNADAGGLAIAEMIGAFVEREPGARLVANAGTTLYFSLMSCAAAMVGNSSSGLIEAASFGLPVVNIGSRQSGRVRADNVIDVNYDRYAIAGGIRRALEPPFRDRLREMLNPYGRGVAAQDIVHVLRTVPLDARLLHKRFFDAAGGEFSSHAVVNPLTDVQRWVMPPLRLSDDN
jgi:UDP-N-acetylglucosamine 2-epimerase (non-hydrolysing)/GDP/UDP-N,N'-diacetylbacillosamine 2-epimerase (hydrolysing)